MKRVVPIAFALMFAVRIPTAHAQTASRNNVFTVVKEIPGRKTTWIVTYSGDPPFRIGDHDYPGQPKREYTLQFGDGCDDDAPKTDCNHPLKVGETFGHDNEIPATGEAKGSMVMFNDREFTIIELKGAGGNSSVSHVYKILNVKEEKASSDDTVTQRAPSRKDIPSIAKAANGAIVTIVTAVDDKPIALGTGFIVSADGVILTNYHVIKTGNVAAVKFSDGTALAVDGLLAADKNRDLAVIKIHGKTFRTLILGNSDQIQIGEDVVAIGNPLGLELTVSNGILSGVRSDEKEGGKFLQTTAPISHGSSGGPLFNMRGQVIGINSMYYEGGENLNFAIPVNDAKHLLRRQSAKLQGLPNEPDLNAPKADVPPTPKVIANERLRAFTECKMEHNRYSYSIVHYSVECGPLSSGTSESGLFSRGSTTKPNRWHSPKSANLSKPIDGRSSTVLATVATGLVGLRKKLVRRIEKLNSEPYAVRVAVLKDSTSLVDRYVLHFYEVTNP